MAEKKRSARSQYLAQFVKKEDGTYEYTGDRYVPVNAEWKRVKQKLLAYYMPALAFLIGAGFIPSAGMVRGWYVIFPFAAAFVMMLYLAVRLVRTTSDQGTVHAYTYERTVQWYGTDALVIMGCETAAAAGEAVCTALNRGPVSFGLAAIAVHALVIYLMYRFRTVAEGTEWKRETGIQNGKSARIG